MKSRIVFIASCLLLVLSTLAFLTDEYNLWDQNLACDAKCGALGCKGGKLMRSEENLTVACKCNSEHDYLLLIN
ncbi:hypothetical protein NI389_20540 (plasmid) [Pseudoalteromonas xiamenensis]|uniref:hypothetical protein n=1 Tax=Pseudoalteromonas xiamenensis TaxID=882626 RepID=UPI0027E43128|nr:hypothetical protein [Pseudoalteromonas xiamenensis]WMN62185.1 hypothetical protein NI389_20540 [Pseudoalteromonas xiamenensis]